MAKLGAPNQVKFTGERTGQGNVTSFTVQAGFRVITDVAEEGSTFHLEVRSNTDPTIWEQGFYRLLAGGELELVLITDTSDRTGELANAAVIPAITFGSATPVTVSGVINDRSTINVGSDNKLNEYSEYVLRNTLGIGAIVTATILAGNTYTIESLTNANRVRDFHIFNRDDPASYVDARVRSGPNSAGDPELFGTFEQAGDLVFGLSEPNISITNTSTVAMQVTIIATTIAEGTA